MPSSTMADTTMSKSSPRKWCLTRILTQCFCSAKYGHPDPERAQEKIEGVDAGREISSEEGSSGGNLSGGQIGSNPKANKQA